jgi:hypothetical protein
MQVDRLEVLIEAEAKKANAELDTLVGKLNQVSSAMSKTSGLKIGGGSSTSNVNSATSSLAKYTKSTSMALLGTRSLTSQLARLAAAFYSVRRAINFMGDSMKKSMDYVETVNLFQTSFKKIGMETAEDLGMEWGSASADTYAKGFIKEAQDFNKMLTESLSLDPQLMMNYQAVFAQMSNSMGLTADTAMNISESFTMLGNDIASLWNKDTDQAMKKLQGGLAGQIRPLRELGIDISQTSLEMTALKYGITDDVKEMSQAAKVQLRWLSIMDQTEVAFGDMAKTISSPANQMRIFHQQWTNLSRSIGNVFLPIISTVLPYINGFAIALRRVVDTIATALGYELPDYTDSNIYTDVTGDIGNISDVTSDAADSTDKATKANEKYRKSLLGIDELNILNKNDSSSSGSGGSGSGAGGGSGYDNLDDAINQKTDSYMAKFNEEMTKMSNKAKEIADIIQPKIEKFVDFLGQIAPLLEGIAVAFITYKIITWFSDLAVKIAAFSMSPAGIVALSIGAFVAIGAALKDLRDDAAEADLKNRFGEIQLSMEDVETVAKRLTDSKYAANIDIYINEHGKLEGLQKNIQDDVDTLNKLNWKVSIGLKLTSGEVEQYKSTVDKFVSDSEAYIDQQQYVVSLALTATITNDDKFLDEMQTATNAYFDASRGEMESLGRKLREATDKALADGVLDANEQKTIYNLQKEMAEITQKAAEYDYEAKMTKLSLDYKDTDITADSFEKVTKRIGEINQERLDSLDTAELTVYSSIHAKYDVMLDQAHTEEERAKITKQMNDEIAEYAGEVSQTKATITLNGLDFSLGTLAEKYQKEIKSLQPYLQKGVDDLWAMTDLRGTDVGKNGMTKWDQDIGLIGHQLETAMIMGLNDTIDVDARLSMEKLFDALEPTREDLNDQFENGLKAGTAIPEGVISALTDASKLGAIGQDMDSINFLLGQKLSTDKSFLTVLSTSETAGKDLDDALIKGLKSKIPDLKAQGNSLVFDLDAAIKNTSSTSVKNVGGYAQSIINAYGNTFEKDKSTKGTVNTWLDTIRNTIKNYKLPDMTQKINFTYDKNILHNVIGDLNLMITSNARPKQYATGGIPGYGEMFIAREAGPELVGRVGRSNAVMNNNQIVSSVSQGVAGAVAQVLIPALSNLGGGQIIENITYLDSDVLLHTFNKAKSSSDRRYNPVQQGG